MDTQVFKSSKAHVFDLSSKEHVFTKRILNNLTIQKGAREGRLDEPKAPNRHELGRIEQIALAKDQGLPIPSDKRHPKRAMSAPGGGRRDSSIRISAATESIGGLSRPQTAISTDRLQPHLSARTETSVGQDSSRRRAGGSKQNGFGIAPRKLLRQVMYSNSDTHREDFPLAPGQYNISLGNIHWRRDLESNNSQQYLTHHKTVPVYSFGRPKRASPIKKKEPERVARFPGPTTYTLPDLWSKYPIKGKSFAAVTKDEEDSRFGNFVNAAKDMEFLGS